MRIGILTVSDKGSRGQRDDTSGPAIRELLTPLGVEAFVAGIVPDERDTISAQLRAWADGEGLDLIVTTGGTGPAPRDVTPEATLDVVERLVPGMAEAMRAEGLRHTPLAMLSRGVCGTRGRTLIVNLPGSERAVRENLAVLLPVLAHAIATAQGRTGDHPTTGAPAERG